MPDIAASPTQLASANEDNTVAAPETPMPVPPPPSIAALFSPGYIVQLMGQFGLGGVFAIALIYQTQTWHTESRQDWQNSQIENKAVIKTLTESIDRNSKATSDLATEIHRSSKKD